MNKEFAIMVSASILKAQQPDGDVKECVLIAKDIWQAVFEVHGDGILHPNERARLLEDQRKARPVAGS